ncbi:uncharacterized protein VTP21DRAFT_9337 [Calcarisporiella thermophila]|uniref:uncharacterized protein n=1 Tax=Calcarisporiella thermophila TaxID=911321 RepID=UPI00374402A2
MSDEEDRHTHDSEGEGEDIPPYGGADDYDDDEEEEEENEEEARRIAEGFIVDDDEEEEEGEEQAVRVSRKKKKRKVLEDDLLDEEDLELVAENTGLTFARPENKLKRLKRGRTDRESESEKPRSDLNDIWADEEEDRAYDRGYRRYDEMDDFIDDEGEEDEQLDSMGAMGERADMHRVRERDSYDQISRPARRSDHAFQGEDLFPETLDELDEIFGYEEYEEFAEEPDEDLLVDDTGEQREPKLKDVFEPMELKEKMLTEEDDFIRMRDVPERMQTRAGINVDRRLTDEEVKEAAEFVTKTLAFERKEVISPMLRDAVQHVLGFLGKEFLEVPFIATHRKDFFTHVLDKEQNIAACILSTDELWRINDLHYKYRSFLERKEALHAYFQQLMIRDDYAEQLLRQAERIEELGDVIDWLRLHYTERIAKLKAERGLKRPMKKNPLYERYKSTTIIQFAEELSISSRDLATNLLLGMRHSFPRDATMNPEEAAEHFVCKEFNTSYEVLRAAKDMLAQEISCEPQVRRMIREIYEFHSYINVRATDKGARIIDERHPYYAFKWLLEKPVTSFNDGQFAQIFQSESDGLTTVEVIVQPESLNRIAEYFRADRYSEIDKQWNKHRDDVIQMVHDMYLRPIMTKWLKEKLRLEALDRIARLCKDELKSRVDVAPYRNERMDPEAYPRVLALTCNEKELIMGAFLDDKGNFLDHVSLENLRESENEGRLIDFLEKRHPDAVIVGGFTLKTRKLLDKVRDIVRDHELRTRDEVLVTLVNDDVAQRYYQSKQAQNEFKELPPQLRYCISMARKLQSPMHEYAALGKDLTSIRFHPLQPLVPQDLLVENLERALVEVVNSVGVDINDCVNVPYRSHVVQYICGFGPRKAQVLIRRIQQEVSQNFAVGFITPPIHGAFVLH